MLPEGATRAPIIADGSVAHKGFPCSKLQGIHKLTAGPNRPILCPSNEVLTTGRIG